MKNLFELYLEHQGNVSDKWSIYLSEYDRLFSIYRDQPVRMLEIGIQNGGSLEIWNKYFPNAQAIIGCDINPDCAKLTYDDHRIKVVVGDANTDPAEGEILNHSPRFDFIIDDGSHTSSDIVKSFARYFRHLNQGGIFVAEDLHCSYWKGFEGGLYYPYSSIAFFKRLADIVNHEHWGVEKDRKQLLRGFSEQFSTEFDESDLAQIHSIEFFNSVCVVHKRKAQSNVLGERIVAGQNELVVSGHIGLNGKSLTQSQSDNPWATMVSSPEEDWQALSKAVAEHDIQIAGVSQALAERDDQIVSMNQVLAERDIQIAGLNKLHETLQARDAELKQLHDAMEKHSEEISAYHDAVMAREAVIASVYSSTSWRITAPVRRLGAALPKLRYRVRGVRGLLQRDGSRPLLEKAWRTYRRDGLKGLRQRAGLALFNYYGAAEHASHAASNLRPLAGYLPVNTTELPPLPTVSVDVIIPVYRGLTETRKCIESALAASCSTRARIIVIDDCSPEPEVSAYLQGLLQSPEFLVLRNKENLGFVGTVNRGMRLEPESDVVLLNSDTEVSDGWLDRLAWHAYSNERVSSVTPFSNNATICSYPRIEGMNGMPGHESLSFLNKAFWEANAGRSVPLPTAIGFCMYIRRACLNEIGLFDEEAFGKGYGEENDFCLRASAAGWEHLLATDTFVYHAGEVSFQSDSSSGKARATKIIRERYPSYEADVAAHVVKAEAEPMRIAATAARYRLSGDPVVLMVTHHLGGGTEKHVGELCRGLAAKARCLMLRPKNGHNDTVLLQSADGCDLPGFEVSLTGHVQFMVDLLKSFGVSYVHVHHIVGMPEAIKDLISGLGVSFDFTVHDYYTICPQINLANDGRYCGEPDAGGCNRCIAKKPSHGAHDIIWWRQKHSWMLGDARRVICPSQDVASRIQQYHPSASVVVANHEVLPEAPLQVPQLATDEPLRVVLLGWLAKHKGSQLVADCLNAARRTGAKNVRFHLIGRSTDDLTLSEIYSETGEYRDEDLGKLIVDADPHVIWLASTAPETYSYTLSRALLAGRAIVVTNLGALPERLIGRPWSWVMPWDTTGIGFLSFFQQIRHYFEEQLSPEIGCVAPASIEDFYDERYARLLAADAAVSSEPALIDLRRRDVNSILVIVEMLGDRPSPCAYIRVLLPLLAVAGKNANIRVIRVNEIKRYVADVVYTHRIAVHGRYTTEVIEHCRQHDMRLIYDLDDDLLGIAESDHPERAHYAAYAPNIRLLAAEADEVRVSTSVMKRRMKRHTANVRLVPNALDAQTWSLDKPQPPREDSNEVAIVYMGTMTHQADFEMVKGALQRIKKTYGNAVSINIIGVTGDRGDADWFRFVDVPSHASGSYPAFVDWLIGLRAFDIGIAPLVESEFNEAKSGIKFLDYTAMGLVSICSDVSAYRDVVEHGVNGLLVTNDEDAWFSALDQLINDVNLKARLVTNAKESVLREHLLQGSPGGVPFQLEHVFESEPV